MPRPDRPWRAVETRYIRDAVHRASLIENERTIFQNPTEAIDDRESLQTYSRSRLGHKMEQVIPMPLLGGRILCSGMFAAIVFNVSLSAIAAEKLQPAAGEILTPA